jgi:isopenicillin N synthase-like dioxygenase
MDPSEQCTSLRPDGPLVTACLEIIDFSKLWSRQRSEISKLLKACQTDGFFYLNVEAGAHEFRNDWLNALSVVKKFYDQPLDVKLRYYRGDGMSG